MIAELCLHVSVKESNVNNKLLLVSYHTHCFKFSFGMLSFKLSSSSSLRSQAPQKLSMNRTSQMKRRCLGSIHIDQQWCQFDSNSKLFFAVYVPVWILILQCFKKGVISCSRLKILALNNLISTRPPSMRPKTMGTPISPQFEPFIFGKTATLTETNIAPENRSS